MYLNLRFLRGKRLRPDVQAIKLPRTAVHRYLPLYFIHGFNLDNEFLSFLLTRSTKCK